MQPVTLDKWKEDAVMSGTTIFGLQPFEPKRQLILPSAGGEIRLFVLEGKAYPATIQRIGSLSRKQIRTIHFEGWTSGFNNASLNIPLERLIDPGDFEHYILDVIFRLVPSRIFGQVAEIVAISYDDCKTFYENESCTLIKEYENV